MRGSVPHILIVDDDPAVVEAFTAALKGAYIVHGAATGEEACAILRAHPIAAIILDAVLGEEHGLDLVERFRELSAAPILILTGHSTEDLAIRAVRAKVDDYLRKPLDLDALHSAVARLLHPREEPATLAWMLPSEVPPPEAVVLARRYLEAHLNEPYAPARLAREVGVSERHLYRQFRAATGLTPRQYLTRVRLVRAAELLRTTPRGIEQIASDVGFRNVTVFNRVFKRAYGVSPSEFRARYRPQDAQERDVPGPAGP
jgi:YesN/AraC family two-component response regulator